MKLSLAVFLLALFTTTLARSPLLEIFKREFEGQEIDGEKEQKIEGDVANILKDGEKMTEDIAGEKHDRDGRIAICALELLEDIGSSFENIFGKDDSDDDDDDDGDDDYKRALRRNKRRANDEFETTRSPYSHSTRGGSHHPSFEPSGGPRKCAGALEKFFKCMKGLPKERGDGEKDGESGESGEGGEGGEGGAGSKRGLPNKRMHKRKVHKTVA